MGTQITFFRDTEGGTLWSVKQPSTHFWSYVPDSEYPAPPPVKIVVFGADKLKVRLLNISNCNRNATILLKMRGHTTYDEVPFPRYGIFLHFQPFSAILASF